MMRRFWAWTIVLLAGTVSASAQRPGSEEAAPPPPTDTYESLSARQAVREGNSRLLEGQVDAALEAYTHAKDLRPDAPQIPFVQGLAELHRKDYDAARDLFRETAASDDDALAADAQYALGASYHMEALESEDPKEAIEHLEAAMERYRDVLARRQDHALARESDYKAASMRRQLKQLLQQQQQQQQQNQDGDEQDDQDQQSDSQDQQEGEQQEQDQQSQSEQQEGEDQQQQQSADQEQDAEQDQSQQQQSESEQEHSESEEQEAQASQQEEEVSREQAERRLREMMQSIRDKQKQRRQKAKKVPLPPVEKDW